MPKLVFTSHLDGLAPDGDVDYPGRTVAEVLDAAFADFPALRHYVLDDQDHLRKHVVIFVDENPLRRGDDLGRPVGAGSEIYVLQALSGG